MMNDELTEIGSRLKDNTYISTSVEETIAFGSQLAERLEPKSVIALNGPLGTGKTHLVKGVAEALGLDSNTVQSPTYSLINEYNGTIPLYHFDCYRMKSIREAFEIGMEDYFYREGICAVEWPEIVKPILPDSTLWIDLKATGKKERIFEVNS